VILGYRPEEDRALPPESGAWLAILFVLVTFSSLVVGSAFLSARAYHDRGSRQQAHVDARTIQAVAEKYVIDHPGRCPTMLVLRDEKEISPSSIITDPWGATYTIECLGDDVVVRSAGPDGKPNTPDDLVAPEPSTAL
jgi:hypothetical protein